MVKTICVFSGKRGGFGAYLPFMQLIQKNRNFKLQILLSDMHVSEKFGKTLDEVKYFFPESLIRVVPMGTGRGGTPLVRAENLGKLMINISRTLNELRPDFLMVHADRGEHLIAAYSALNLGDIVVCHTQGGEVSGNIDDIQRHAITKLSHIHFPETKEAAKRIENLGEERWRIHPVGSLYIDRIKNKLYTSSGETRKKYGFGEREDYFIVIFHPDTYKSAQQNYLEARTVYGVVGSFGPRSIIIYPCSDPGYEGVIKAIEEIADRDNFLVFKNIDNLDFLGLMSGARLLIGNSSSALVEAPYLHLAAVNIGDRQRGRDREGNVVDVKADKGSIKKAMFHCLTNKGFRKQLSKCGRYLGKGDASQRILKVLEEAADEKILRKLLRDQN